MSRPSRRRPFRALSLVVALAVAPASLPAQDQATPIQEIDDDDDGFDDWGLLGLLGLAGLLGRKRDDRDRVADTRRV